MGYYIYTLSDINNIKEVRYVGITNNISRRLSQHINSSIKPSSHKECWIKSLKNTSDLFIQVIENVLNKEVAKEREIYYIKHYKDLGYNLTNSTSGGDGVKDYKPSEEVKQKHREAKLKNPTRYWLGKKRKHIEGFGKGRPLGLKHSLETKLKMSEIAKKRKYTEGVKLKMSETRKGIPSTHSWKKLLIEDTFTDEQFVINGYHNVADKIGCKTSAIHSYFKRNSKLLLKRYKLTKLNDNCSHTDI
jgi:group I intron endonuclease